MEQLEKEFEYYLQNQDALAKEHEGKVLVIKDQKVIGVYGSEEQAIEAAGRDHELGTFLVQRCSADPNSVIQTFHSRVGAYGQTAD